jgi:hypothetical protein
MLSAAGLCLWGAVHKTDDAVAKLFQHPVFAVTGATTFYLLLTVSRKCILRWQADAERQRDEGLEAQERRRTNHLKYTLLAIHTAGLVSVVVGLAICARAAYLCKNILVLHVTEISDANTARVKFLEAELHVAHQEKHAAESAAAVAEQRASQAMIAAQQSSEQVAVAQQEKHAAASAAAVAQQRATQAMIAAQQSADQAAVAQRERYAADSAAAAAQQRATQAMIAAKQSAEQVAAAQRERHTAESAAAAALQGKRTAELAAARFMQEASRCRDNVAIGEKNFQRVSENEKKCLNRVAELQHTAAAQAQRNYASQAEQFRSEAAHEIERKSLIAFYNKFIRGSLGGTESSVTVSNDTDAVQNVKAFQRLAHRLNKPTTVAAIPPKAELVMSAGIMANVLASGVKLCVERPGFDDVCQTFNSDQTVSIANMLRSAT